MESGPDFLESGPLLSAKAQIPFIAHLVFQLNPAQTPQGVEIQKQLFIGSRLNQSIYQFFVNALRIEFFSISVYK